MTRFTLLTLTILALSSFAQANSPMGSPILTYTKTNGAVAPKYRKSTKCEFKNSEITVTNTGPEIRQVPITVDAKYTAKVRNIKEVRRLVIEAGPAYVTNRGSIPVGGGVKKIEAALPSQSYQILLKGPRGRYLVENMGDAGQALIEFMVYNCDEQLPAEF
jgi:hypothetical protein